MPPRYSVAARVIDIRTDTPRPSDRLFIDTNVWAWAHYFQSGVTGSGVVLQQRQDYSPYLAKTRAVNAIRYRTANQFAELAHLIEQNELDAYSTAVGPLSLKDYRHNVPSEHGRVVSEIWRAWDRVEADSDLLVQLQDEAFLRAVRSLHAAAAVDGYDLFHLEAMAYAGVTQILSDDGDFCTMSGIEVFTANPRVLAAARAQGRLVVR